MPWNVLGSAKFSDDHGYWRYDASVRPINGGRVMLLGGTWNDPGFLHVRPPLQHFLSIAQTRSGKGVSLIIPNLLTYAGSVLVVDPKGENAWVTAEHRRRMGQRVYILDPWKEVNRRYGALAGIVEVSARFNPLSILQSDTDDFVEDLAYLADALIISESTDNPYWDNAARELWAGLMAYVVEHPQFREHASLGLARALLMKSEEEFAQTIDAAIELGPGSIAARKLAQFKNALKDDSRALASVMSNARTQTSFLDSETLNTNMDSSDFSFSDLCGANERGIGAATIYLVLPPEKLKTYSRWLRLMISIGIRSVSRGGGAAPGLPVLFMLDEFGTIGKLDAVAQAYGLMAGLGMSVWAFTQDLNQLKVYYPNHWETFIGNSTAITCFGVMDNFTVDYISKMLGTQTVQQPNVSSTGLDETFPTSVTRSTQTMSRPLLYPDEISQLDERYALILGRFAPILVRRICYYRDWDLLHRARPDPGFPCTESVRWTALESYLREMGSVGKLLEMFHYRLVKRGRGWEVRGTNGQPGHTFRDADELWRWTYLLAMDREDTAA
jgi:type IV secretion system protein VirD4